MKIKNTDTYIFSVHDVMSFATTKIADFMAPDLPQIDMVRDAVQELFLIHVCGPEADLFLDDAILEIVKHRENSVQFGAWLKEEIDKMFDEKIRATIGELDLYAGIPEFNWISPTDVSLRQMFTTGGKFDLEKGQYDKHLSEGLGQ